MIINHWIIIYVLYVNMSLCNTKKKPRITIMPIVGYTTRKENVAENASIVKRKTKNPSRLVGAVFVTFNMLVLLRLHRFKYAKFIIIFMTDCHYCTHKIKPDETLDINGDHKDCADEIISRQDNHVCIWCKTPIPRVKKEITLVTRHNKLFKDNVYKKSIWCGKCPSIYVF